MRDQVRMVIGSNEVSTFIEYEADSHLLTPADAFSCRLGRVETEIKAGEGFRLYVNGALEMTGLIDRVTRSYSRGALETRLEGRDLMGILVDSSVEEFRTLHKMELKDLAERLLKNVPFLDKSRIRYGGEKADSGLSRKKIVKKENQRYVVDDESNACQFSPGVSVFEALSDYSQRHGLIFWMDPEGALVFGVLKGPRDGVDFEFRTVREPSEAVKNNIVSAMLSDDVSKRYSRVTVKAQLQGTDDRDAGEQDVTRRAFDRGFPFYKPLVIQSSCTSREAAGFQAQWELKKRDAEGWRVELTAPGHSQNGKNYRANSVCHLKDEVLGLDGNFLILGRRFTMDRDSGPRTVLTIGRLMEGYAVQ